MFASSPAVTGTTAFVLVFTHHMANTTSMVNTKRPMERVHTHSYVVQITQMGGWSEYIFCVRQPSTHGDMVPEIHSVRHGHVSIGVSVLHGRSVEVCEGDGVFCLEQHCIH